MYYRLKEHHAAQAKALTAQVEHQRSQIMRMEKEMADLRAELSAQKEANVRSPSNTMKNLVEDQKRQLTKKDRHIKVGPFFYLVVMVGCGVLQVARLCV